MDNVDEHDVVFYQGVDQFITLNPKCCEVIDNIKGYEPTFGDRFSGSTSAIVKVDVKVIFKEKTNLSPAIRTEYLAISNCGKAWNGY
ncbi:hypothetical protein [Hahella sp. HN01]|uniref:hypothetical protein n=1 Tax=Hahella sp. HN01 TaxID=2847262 RepID=UPI001C1EFF44|nr:hypothetical protein [Hahella sp. HN01]MBU6950481.1 hypothetical protein [Hahella sp. HN01]